MEDNLNEDILKKLYYNEFEALYEVPKTKEYIKITKKIKGLEKILLKENNNNQIRRYMEYINERMGLEAENQFMIGFKTAIKIILQSLK